MTAAHSPDTIHARPVSRPGPTPGRSYCPVPEITAAHRCGFGHDGYIAPVCGPPTHGRSGDRSIRYAPHPWGVHVRRRPVPPSALEEHGLSTDAARTPTGSTSGSGPADNRVRVIREGVASYLPDIDPEETTEWIESFDDMLARSGPAREIGRASCRERV